MKVISFYQRDRIFLGLPYTLRLWKLRRGPSSEGNERSVVYLTRTEARSRLLGVKIADEYDVVLDYRGSKLDWWEYYNCVARATGRSGKVILLQDMVGL